MERSVDRRIFERLACILDYPRPGAVEAAQECAALVRPRCPEAARLVLDFHTSIKGMPLGALQEVYTGTFDLDAACYPYIGYHLFGESYKRSVLMLGLRERYEAHGFAAEGELPDHLAVMLRFLAACDDDILAGELAREALLPALDKMIKAGPGAESAGDDERPERRAEIYQPVLQAVRLLLQGLADEQAQAAEDASVTNLQAVAA